MNVDSRTDQPGIRGASDGAPLRLCWGPVKGLKAVGGEGRTNCLLSTSLEVIFSQPFGVWCVSALSGRCSEF